MPINTDLNISPYYDDYDETKDFYKVLFRPGVSVQARELNQLQTILQKQIERFGDNIFKRGTIIDGCQFTFEKVVPFVKIKDIETDGTAVNVDFYVDKYVRNDTNKLSAHIISATSGFESADPDLNTLFVRYRNSGSSKTSTAFSNGDTLRVYDANNSIFGVTTVSGSANVANTNSVVFVSAIAVTNTLGGTFFGNSFVVGDSVRQTVGSSTSNLVITAVDSTTNTQALILKVRPQYVSLAASNTAAWTLKASSNTSEWLSSNGAGANAAVGIIVDLIGSGATASLTTDSIVGAIQSIEMLTQGDGYYVAPYVSISGASSGAIANVSLIARNYAAEITVAENITTPSVGNGYAFSVSDGVIYQKGYFSRVTGQRVIVEKYSSYPHERVVGFDTQESIVNSNIDASLLDNATGTYNFNAPGANRLKLEPVLVVLDTADAYANDEFFSIVEWSEGYPFKQNRNTQFNSITRELAQRTYEESGNYVLDPFYLYTKSNDTFAAEANSFNVVIDPGLAYINGYRVETNSNFSKNIQKGITSNTDTRVTSNTVISVNYGNYIFVNEIGGVFSFNYGDTISLRDTVKTYLTGDTLATPAAAGTEIGQARIRSMVYYSGEPGTPNAVYKLYLFDITMNAGKNFKNVKSVYYNGAGSNDGVADIVLDVDGTTGLSIAQVKERSNSTLLIYSGVDALKNANNINYTYRTINTGLSINATAQFEVSLAGSYPAETWPYSGTLSTNEKEDIIIVPLANGFVSANATGTVTANSSTANLIGSSTTFVADYQVGDYIQLANATISSIRRISSIVNNEFLVLSSAPTQVGAGAKTKLVFPQYVPIPFSTRSGRTAAVSGNVLTVSLGLTMNAAFSVAATYNVKFNTTGATKTSQRKRYVKIRPANNVANVSANAAGSVSVNTTSATVTGTSTSFDTAFAANDYIAIWANSTHWNLRQISSVTNSTVLTLTSNGFVANTSANVAKVNSVNLNGPWAIGVPDIFRMRGVYKDTTSAVNTTSSDVSTAFYIDHNQTEDFYDNGYLFKKPTSSYTIGFDDYYLVEFDRLTVSGEGLKYLGSYPLDDTKPLANLDATPENSYINTLELPEVFGKQGTYYDVRDYFDLRPYSANTVAPANSTTYAASAPVNPTEISFASRFTSTDKKFPAPESDITATIENYLPRKDAVVVTPNGQFTVVKGTHNGSYPSIPSSTILINYLDIPPYPSLPFQLSSDMADIIDTQIANEKFAKKRVKNYSIKTPLSSTDISRSQPRAYSMEKIGELERRIADLEYYTSLSFTEDTVKNTTITSSNDPALERFKFGYFVDNFSTTDFSDLDNPEFNATIFNYELGPKKKQLNLEFKFDPADATASLITGGIATLPYTEYSLVQQLLVTDGAVSSNGITNTSTSVTTVCVPVLNKNQQYNKTSGAVVEITSFVFASNSGIATISFDAFGAEDRIEVYQNTTPSFSYSGTTPITTSENSVTLSAAERTALTANGVFKTNSTNVKGPWTTSNRPDRTFATKGSNTKYWIKNAGKLTWTHDPSKGLYYKIVVVKGSPNFSYYICYPTNANTTIASTTTLTTAPTPVVHTGAIIHQYSVPSLVLKPKVAVSAKLDLAKSKEVKIDAKTPAPKPTKPKGNPRS